MGACLHTPGCHPTPAAPPDLQALGIPRVALLFLTKGQLPHEPTWRLWLEAAAGLLPAQALPAAQVRPRARWRLGLLPRCHQAPVHPAGASRLLPC